MKQKPVKVESPKEESILVWQCRIDLVGKTNPPINYSFTDIFLAEDQNEAIDLSVACALKRFNNRNYRFISQVVVSKYFINRPQNKTFQSGQGCSMFWWRHDSPKTLEEAVKESKL